MNSVKDIQVLLVDDNRQMRALVRSLLRAAGVYRVAEAEGSVEAFDLMHRFQIDLIIADWMMRPIDGIAFTKMVRLAKDSPSPMAPILMLTAHTEVSRVAQARDAGVNGFIKKPISARLLFERISAALLDTRPFVRTETFFGPDRRRGADPRYVGPHRRASDRPDFIDLEDERLRA